MNNPNAYEVNEWLQYGVCTVPGAPSMFPSDGDRHGIELAKSVCAVCPVAAECLVTALARGEQWGIWGGMTTNERKSFRRKQLRGGRLVTDVHLPDTA